MFTYTYIYIFYIFTYVFTYTHTRFCQFCVFSVICTKKWFWMILICWESQKMFVTQQRDDRSWRYLWQWLWSLAHPRVPTSAVLKSIEIYGVAENTQKRDRERERCFFHGFWGVGILVIWPFYLHLHLHLCLGEALFFWLDLELSISSCVNGLGFGNHGIFGIGVNFRWDWNWMYSNCIIIPSTLLRSIFWNFLQQEKQVQIKLKLLLLFSLAIWATKDIAYVGSAVGTAWGHGFLAAAKTASQGDFLSIFLSHDVGALSFVGLQPFCFETFWNISTKSTWFGDLQV